ncbi:MAG: 3-deoxy-manno-octulosonate cytidylyltransferase [Spirosomataceae bacterium]
MNIIGIIPARYASTRFPAKALADIGGKSMIQRVYEQACQAASLTKVVVATDHPLIYTHVREFGGNVVMTAETHPSGTDRCYEALQKVDSDRTIDYVVNIQGDEPFIQPAQIELLTDLLDGTVEIATLIKVIDSVETLFDPHTPKVVVNEHQEALYFSRQTIPFLRGIEPEQWLNEHTYYKHLGIYAYRADILGQLTQLQPSSLEKAESLEQLRWLQHGYRIRVAVTPFDSHGVDLPSDLERIKKFLG